MRIFTYKYLEEAKFIEAQEIELLEYMNFFFSEMDEEIDLSEIVAGETTILGKRSSHLTGGLLGFGIKQVVPSNARPAATALLGMLAGVLSYSLYKKSRRVAIIHKIKSKLGAKRAKIVSDAYDKLLLINESDKATDMVKATALRAIITLAIQHAKLKG